MENKLVKTVNGYNVINAITGAPVAALIKEKKGYTKLIYSDARNEFFRPVIFNYFATLRDARRYYEIDK